MIAHDRGPRARSRLSGWLGAGLARSLDPSERRKIAIANAASLAAFVTVAALSLYYAFSPYEALRRALLLQLPLLPIYVCVPWLHARERAAWARRLLLAGTALVTALGVHFVFGAAIKLQVIYAVIAVAALVIYPAEQRRERNALVAALVAGFAYVSLATPAPSALFAEVPAHVVRLLSAAFPTVVIAVIWIVVVVTEGQAEANEVRLERQSTRDALTGIANRRALAQELEHAIRHARRYGDGVAVLYLDLDGFKAVNDLHGHAAGDAVLIEVAARLTRLLRPTDLAARVGGDEFCVLVSCLEGDATSESVALAEAAIAALGAPYDIGAAIGVSGLEVSCGSSVGVAVLGKGESAETILSRADEAMYAAKSAGKGRVALAPAASA